MNNSQTEKHRPNISRIIRMVIFGIITAVFFAFIFGYIVLLLWNWLMPELFDLKTITYWQGFGLVLLAKILFGGFGGHHDHNHDKKHRDHFYKFVFKRGNGKDTEVDSEYFEKFWEEEGKEAFNEYVKRMGEEKK